MSAKIKQTPEIQSVQVRGWLNVLLFGGRHWNISSSLQLMEKIKNNQEADTSIIHVHIHKKDNTGPDPELTGVTGL